ncbi:MAG: CoA activase [Acidobacteria bacterium]|nr:MAG: CoA activase [Acidobacteriota bacterium]
MNSGPRKLKQYRIGIDVGSTTVKVVACPADGDDLLFRTYRRHEGRQAETLLSCLQELQDSLGMQTGTAYAFITGSGGGALAGILGAKFVQEVTAVSMAVEKLFPEVHSVIELGGQDSKIIVFKETGHAGQKKKLASMNDKCAGGTGAVIDKIAAKLNLSPDQLRQQKFDGVPIHPVAGKCGVFAETDITGFQKQGVPPSELIASLFNAIVLQNLTVLTRGHLLLPRVLLLGGPHVFLPGLREAWRQHLARMWRDQNVTIPEDVALETLVSVPADAQYFGAIGALEYGRTESAEVGNYLGIEPLAQFVNSSSALEIAGGTEGLCKTEDELRKFLRDYTIAPRPDVALTSGEIPVFVGIDGGSTSTKAVLLSPDGQLLASAYRLSRADPIADAIAVLQELYDRFRRRGVRLSVLGAAITGYSKDLLQRVLGADVALVETVAHAHSALQVRHDVDAIIDVGGQDIKIVLLQNGAVKDFRLNTQCSAGNGYFLQATAETLGIPIETFAETAFRANRMPVFSYGCAVFLQSDIVNFQRQGWRPEELIAGLAAVLPKNVFLYVAGVSNVAKLGKRFLLQGGTQRNLAVVKAEIDFIRSHYFAEGEPEIFLHPNCGEAGSIGAALEAIRRYSPERPSRFISLDQLSSVRYTIRRDESTRCSFCANKCHRTFIDYSCATPQFEESSGQNRVIIASCERGEALDVSKAREVNSAWSAVCAANPCIPSLAAREAWSVRDVPLVTHTSATKRNGKRLHDRSSICIGIPRVLNLYAYAPLLTSYLQGLGVRKENIIFSATTNPTHFKEAVGFAAVDPCFPAKLCISHVFHLLQKNRDAHVLDYIFFPMIDTVVNNLEKCAGVSSCPTGAATPEAVKAAFSANRNWFGETGIGYLNPILNLSDRRLFRFQMFECWKDVLAGLSWEENAEAVEQAFLFQEQFDLKMRQVSRDALDRLEREGRIGLVLLARPYHHDPGVNQDILESFQKLGYPVFSQAYLPLDEDVLNNLFGEEVGAGVISSPLDISDVWKNSVSANTNLKLWAAKFMARHPNLIPVELSSFKCGHDAFASNVIEQISVCAGKPHFCFRDLDENKPQGSLRLRIETMHFFLSHLNSSGDFRCGSPALVQPQQERETVSI